MLTAQLFNLLAIEINSYEAHMNDLMRNDTASRKVEISTNLSMNLQAAKDWVCLFYQMRHYYTSTQTHPLFQSECENGKVTSEEHMCPMNWDAPICYTPTGTVPISNVFKNFKNALEQPICDRHQYDDRSQLPRLHSRF